MKSIGIKIKSNTCILALVESADDLCAGHKIELMDSYDALSVKDFFKQLKDWLDTQSAEVISIKKRGEKGKFSGGACSFKIEGLVQLVASVPVRLVGGPELNRLAKTITDFPEMKKYQEQAYLAALSAL